MGSLRVAAPLVVLALAAAACVGDGGVSAPPSTPPSSTPSAPPSPSSAPSPSITEATTAPCDDSDVLAAVGAATEAARLAPVTAWSTDVAGNPFTDRTATGEVFAARLGFDCGLRATEVVGGDERLVVAAWTGPRMAWVVQTSETPAAPYAPQATVTLSIAEADGEYLDDDTRTLWAGTLDSGETVVVGHVDFSLGAAAKEWYAHREPFTPPPTDLAAERHGILALEAAGMREIDIAQPAQVGSEEGYVQFVSPTGQISVADVAPTGWFDPMTPRYYDGPTRTVTIDGAQVRITEPGPDAPEYAIAAEVGFACDGFVWILEPPLNGDADELLASAEAVLTTDECRAG